MLKTPPIDYNTYSTILPMMSESCNPDNRLPTLLPTDSDRSVTFFLSFFGVLAIVRSSCNL